MRVVKSAAEGDRAKEEGGRIQTVTLFSTLQPHGPHRIFCFSLLSDASCQPVIIAGVLPPSCGSAWLGGGQRPTPHRPGTSGQGRVARPSDVHLELPVLTRGSLADPRSATALPCDPRVSQTISTCVHTLGLLRELNGMSQGKRLAER